MKKILQNKSLLKSIQIFLVCLVVLGGGLLENSKAEAACSIPGSYPLATSTGCGNTYSYSRTNENVTIGYAGGQSYIITDPGLTVLFKEPHSNCATEFCGFFTLLKENATGDYYFLIGENDFMPNQCMNPFSVNCNTDVCRAFYDNLIPPSDFIPIISENLIGGTINYSIIFTGVGASYITADNTVDKIHFVFSDFMGTNFLTMKGWSYVDESLMGAGTIIATVDICDIFPPPTCTLTANPGAIVTGGSSTLIWTTADAATVTIDDGSGAVNKALNGDESVSPAATTTYTLTAANDTGAITTTCLATVTITVPPSPPLCDPSLSLFCNPLKSKTNSIADSLTLTALYLLSVAGVITLAFMVIAGIRYIISAGNQEKMKSAKDALFSAGYGLAIIVLSYTILFIIHGILNA